MVIIITLSPFLQIVTDQNYKIEQCISYAHHLITQTVFNLSSDIMIIAIPVSRIARISMNLKRYVFFMSDL
jgi:hypothetical protein